jgi:hypothetical protein
MAHDIFRLLYVVADSDFGSLNMEIGTPYNVPLENQNAVRKPSLTVVNGEFTAHELNEFVMV